MARLLFLSPFQPRQRWVPRCPDPLQLKRQAPVPVMRKWPSLLGAALRIAWKWNADSWNSKPRQLVERRVKERWKVQVSDPLRKETMREVCVCTDIWELWDDVTRDDSQGRFFAQHSIATLLRHCNAVLREKSSLRIVSCNIIFSIDDNDGSENVTIKINSRFFNVFCVYSKLLKMPNVGEWPQAGFLGTVHKCSKTKKKVVFEARYLRAWYSGQVMMGSLGCTFFSAESLSLLIIVDGTTTIYIIFTSSTSSIHFSIPSGKLTELKMAQSK